MEKWYNKTSNEVKEILQTDLQRGLIHNYFFRRKHEKKKKEKH